VCSATFRHGSWNISPGVLDLGAGHTDRIIKPESVGGLGGRKRTHESPHGTISSAWHERAGTQLTSPFRRSDGQDYCQRWEPTSPIWSSKTPARRLHRWPVAALFWRDISIHIEGGLRRPILSGVVASGSYQFAWNVFADPELFACHSRQTLGEFEWKRNAGCGWSNVKRSTTAGGPTRMVVAQYHPNYNARRRW